MIYDSADFALVDKYLRDKESYVKQDLTEEYVKVKIVLDFLL